MARTFVCAIFFLRVAAAVTLHDGAWTVEVSPATLSAEATGSDGRHATLSRAAMAASTVQDLEANTAEAHWKLPQQKLGVSASLTAEGFRITFQSTEPGPVTWPILGEEPGLEAVVLPRAEGLYVPFTDARSRTFLQEQSPLDTMEGLSMPMWGLRYPGLTVAYIAENPFDNELSWTTRGAELWSQLTHRFQHNQPAREHSVLVRFGGTSPVEAAILFREWFSKHYQVTTYPEKIRALPDAERLLGAAHIYLWAHSVLAPEDVTNWPGLVHALSAPPVLHLLDDEAQRAVHEAGSAKFITVWQKRPILAAMTAMKSDALAALEPYLVPRKQWGAGISPKMMRRLHEAGFDRLWLGVGDIKIVRSVPETVTLARQYGYLFAPYDSYHSIHSPSEKDTWDTAQFGQELYDKAGIVNQDGTRNTGFNGKGVHLSSNAAFPYVVRRVEGILNAVPFNSWFVDCDATGELFDNYSTAFPQTKEQDLKLRLERMSWIRDQKHLVVGSEGGAWYAASVIHFAHGMMTPLFGWRDPLLRDPNSKYFLGRYYPPEGPSMFLKPVELPEKYRALYYDPRYRLPLFQAAFHDMVITTNHWSQGSLKFTNVAQVRELLELLHGVPPLYHLNLEEFNNFVPAMQAHYRVFSPLHREIGGLPMTSFDWLSPDHLVQRSVFGGKTEVVANFGTSDATYHGTRIPPLSLLVRGSIYTPLAK